MNWNDGIRTFFSSWKLLMFVLISLLLLFLISFQGYVVSKQSTKTIEGQYYRIIVENMESLSVNLSNYLNYIDDFARTLSNNPDLIRVLQEGGADSKKKAAEQIQAFSEYYHLRLPVNIQILDNEENVYAYPAMNAWEERGFKETVSNFSWFERRVALDNNFLHWNVNEDFHNDRSSNVLYVSKNIIQNSRSLGLLVMELNGTLIERMLNRAQINDQNPILIFSGDMQTLFYNEALPTKLSADADSLRSVYQKVKAENKDQGSLDIRLAGTPYRLIYKQISSTPWTMVSLIPPYLLHTDSVNIWRMTAYMTIISLVIIVLFFGILYTKVTKPLRYLSRLVRNAGNGRMPRRYAYSGFREIETLNSGIFQFFQEIQEQFQTIKQGEGEKRRLELQMLQEQMRPHFWHNSLNSLRFLAVLHGDHTMAEALLSLTRMLDYTLRNTDVLYSTLEEEKEYTLSFVRFQEIRSMQQIKVELDLDKRALQALIPKFTIQPIVENAVLHGFAPPCNKDTEVSIRAAVRGEALVIEIEDNGNGIEAEALDKLFDQERRSSPKSSGISLINLRKRIRHEYGAPYGIELESEINRFTRVTIVLPYVTPDAKQTKEAASE